MKIKKFLRKIKEYVEGDFAYQNYLEHCQKNHSDRKILTKEEFFKMQQKQKWEGVNKCC